MTREAEPEAEDRALGEKLCEMLRSTPGQIAEGGAHRKITSKRLKKFEAVLEASIQCLAEEGFHNTTLARVAQRLGATRGGLQYYFSSTEEMLQASIEYLVWRRRSVIEAAVLALPRGPGRYRRAQDSLIEQAAGRYNLAWVELLAAGRTDDRIRALVQEGIETRNVDVRRTWASIVESATPAQAELFDAVTDLWSAVDTSVALGRFPDRRRLDAMIRVLRRATFHLLDIDPQEAAQEAHAEPDGDVA